MRALPILVVSLLSIPSVVTAQVQPGALGAELMFEDRFEGKPDATNTGLPAGTILTVMTGDQTFAIDNQVISGKDIHGAVSITGKNVTLQNSIVRGTNPLPVCSGSTAHNSSVIWIRTGGSATLRNVEVAPTVATACLDGIWAESVALRAVNIHGAVDGVKAYDNVTILDSYIHDLTRFAQDPNQGGGETHNDAVQTYEANQHIYLIQNNFTVSSGDNATYQLTQDSGQPAGDIYIRNNWLDGGGCTLNFAHKTLTSMTGIYVLNNRFGRHSFYNCPILISTQTVLSQNAGNVWEDTGLPIPPPQQHD